MPDKLDDWLDLDQEAQCHRQAKTIDFRPADLDLQAYFPMSAFPADAGRLDVGYCVSGFRKQRSALRSHRNSFAWDRSQKNWVP
jgi:hypothetical protein